MANKKKPELEQSLDDLEQIVQRLEQGDMPLGDSLKAFEQGIHLARQCQGILAAAEQTVQQLIEQNGELKTAPFDDMAD